MKKVIFWLIAFATLLTAVSCNKEQDGGKPLNGALYLTKVEIEWE